MRSVVVVRPYSRSIRERVFAILSGAGLAMDQARVIAAGTPDAEVLRVLRRARPDALLVPFHAHRDSDGQLINGLDLLRQLHQECPEFDGVPVFMPISAMGMSSASLMLSRGEDAGGIGEALRAHVLFMSPEDLASPAIGRRVTAHLGSHRIGQSGGRASGPFDISG